jgi:protein TonB
MGDVHGYVTLEVLVGTDGSVRNVTIVNDELGLGCGAAAEAAVRQWVFNPATQGGVPVELTTQVQVRFDIE